MTQTTTCKHGRVHIGTNSLAPLPALHSCSRRISSPLPTPPSLPHTTQPHTSLAAQSVRSHTHPPALYSCSRRIFSLPCQPQQLQHTHPPTHMHSHPATSTPKGSSYLRSTAAAAGSPPFRASRSSCSTHIHQHICTVILPQVHPKAPPTCAPQLQPQDLLPPSEPQQLRQQAACH
jgi:hypothetical protein